MILSRDAGEDRIFQNVPGTIPARARAFLDIDFQDLILVS